MDWVILTFSWAFPKAKKANEQGFHIEAITICINGINALLRLGLLQTAQLEQGSKDIHPYLLDTIMNYDNKLAGNASERNIYDEAYRKKVIDKSLNQQLHKLHEDRNRIIHKLFNGVVIKANEIDESELKRIGSNYLPTYLQCQEAVKNLALEQKRKDLLDEAFIKALDK